MSVISDLVAQGYGGYAGWNDNAAAAADFKATGGAGKFTGGSSSSGSSGSSDASSIAAQVTAGVPQLTGNDLALYKSLDPSSLDYAQFQKSAGDQYTPYYTNLLENAGWDLNTAKQRLQEDRDNQYSTSQASSSASLRQLLGLDVPKETKQTLGGLNQRGLLGTVTDRNNSSSQYTLPDGTTMNVDPTTTANFGGMGGDAISNLRTSQALRQQAIERAQKTSEQNSALTLTRGNQDLAQQQKVQYGANYKPGDISTLGGEVGQQRTQNVENLAATQYARAISKNQAKQQALLNPYLKQSA